MDRDIHALTELIHCGVPWESSKGIKVIGKVDIIDAAQLAK